MSDPTEGIGGEVPPHLSRPLPRAHRSRHGAGEQSQVVGAHVVALPEERYHRGLMEEKTYAKLHRPAELD